MNMKLYNSLSKQKEEVIPLRDNEISMYHCGPTVYDHIHIGNLRSFLLGDITRRIFEFLGYTTKQVMNITDVGHLVSDGDEGDDKMTKALKREGMEITLENMLSVAEKYTQSFIQDLHTLNIHIPHYLPKASDHIQEDIDIIQKLEVRGFTYQTSDGIYFRTSHMPSYGALGGIGDQGTSRIHVNSEKEHPSDFALWKFDEKHGWASPWGQGFPGWHIECSGMGMKYLGEQFDIHTGGSDLMSIHHNNEIAQSECATGCSPYVSYWLHGGMLNMKGAKLSKSTGGNITLATLNEQGIDPLAYRYLCLQSHYRSPMNFSFEILSQAQEGYKKIVNRVKDLASISPSEPHTDLLNTFTSAILDDMNVPQALAVFHEALKLEDQSQMLATIFKMDVVLGLRLSSVHKTQEDALPASVIKLLEERKIAREEKNWDSSDAIRKELLDLGFEVRDINGDQDIRSI